MGKLRVLPLGGLGEIGKNMTVIEYDGRIDVLDTGLMYRAVALAALRARIAPDDEDACAKLARTVDLRVVASGDPAIFLGDEDVTNELKSPPVEAAVWVY